VPSTGALLVRLDGALAGWFAAGTDAVPALRAAVANPIPSANSRQAA
jgi:hypothetical protein